MFIHKPEPGHTLYQVKMSREELLDFEALVNDARARLESGPYSELGKHLLPYEQVIADTLALDYQF
jgi:hypothetical protein